MGWKRPWKINLIEFGLFFSVFPEDRHSYQFILNLGLKMCLVSPEIINRVNDILVYKERIF